MKLFTKVLSVFAVGLSISSCGIAQQESKASMQGPVETRNIVEVAQAAGNFNTLLAAAQAAGLAETLATTDNLTVFAPTDEAFAKLPAGTVDALLKDLPALRNVLTYHVIGSKVPASVAVTLTKATMLNGSDVAIRLDGKDLFINSSKVIVTDVPAKNGVIHVIDAVLIPQK
jgi:uncharacterized surface protein with fasciclin (FAS1) repeats